MERFGLSAIQAQAILDMRLARLQGLEREKLDKEYSELMDRIAYYRAILSDEAMLMEVRVVSGKDEEMGGRGQKRTL